MGMSDTKKMKLPEAAVEAALEAFYANCDVDFDGLHAVKAALEAAAPFMLAAAWDEGGESAIQREHTYGAEEKAKFSNPYKTVK